MKNSNRNQSPRPATHVDPTNLTPLIHERRYNRAELERILKASAQVLGLEETVLGSFGGTGRVLRLASTALVVAGARAEAAEAAGTLQGTAWASYRDLKSLVLMLGTPAERKPAASAPKLGDTLSPQQKADLDAAVQPTPSGTPDAASSPTPSMVN